MKRTLALLLMFIFLLSGCLASEQSNISENESESAAPVSEPTPEPKPELESAQAFVPPKIDAFREPRLLGQLDAIRYEQGNSANGGIVTEDVENIYFTNHNDNACIYVYNKETQKVRKLEGTEHAANLHLEGEYIYYTGSNPEAEHYTYRIKKDGSGKERVFEDKGYVLRYPQNEQEPWYLHLYPTKEQYRLDPQTGEKTFVFDKIYAEPVTYDSTGKMWFSEGDFIIPFKLFEFDALSDGIEANRIDVSAFNISNLQYLDGYLYYRENGHIERAKGAVYVIDPQTYQENLLVPEAPTVEERVGSDDSVVSVIVPGALSRYDLIFFHNLLVTDEYIISAVQMPNDIKSKIIRITRDTMEIKVLYNNIHEEYGPDLIGIADGKIFFTTAAYPYGMYEYTKVVDLEGNRLDKQFGLINKDTPPDS